jgi:hypothetical protein
MADLEQMLRERFVRLFPNASSQLQTAEFDPSGLSATFKDFKVNSVTPLTRPSIIATSTYDNGTDLDANQQFTNSVTTQYQQTITNTNTFTISGTDSHTVNVGITLLISAEGRKHTARQLRILRATPTPRLFWRVKVGRGMPQCQFRAESALRPPL